jgi:hypothetical protein
LILCHSHSNEPPVNESSPFEKETTNWIELFPPLAISLELDYSFRFWDLYVEELSVFCLYSRTQVYQAVIAPGSRSKTIPFSWLCHQLATGFDIVIITGRPIREQWRCLIFPIVSGTLAKKDWIIISFWAPIYYGYLLWTIISPD